MDSSSCAYWASRVEFILGDPSNAIHFLKISSNYPNTFYGKLAIKSLGYYHRINFELPNISENFISWLSLQKGGLRALALLQVEEYWHADREIRKLYPITPEKFHLELMSFASKYGMPSIAYRLADIQSVETGIKWYAALYPDLIFENEYLKIPHPKIQNRRFNLLPLVLLDPFLIHPLLNKTQKELSNSCNDNLKCNLTSEKLNHDFL